MFEVLIIQQLDANINCAQKIFVTPCLKVQTYKKSCWTGKMEFYFHAKV